VHGHLLRAPSCINEWRNAFGVISRFDLNATSSWWRTWNSRGACSSWNWTPSRLILWYFSKLSHPCDLVTSHPASSDEFKTVCENCYEIEDTSIFAWFSISDVKHYWWLRGPIRRLPLNSKVDYLVCTICRILDFL
jgi:hypothetical protein